MHRDVVFMPQSSTASASAEQLLRIFSLMRDFQFRWLMVAQQDADNNTGSAVREDKTYVH